MMMDRVQEEIRRGDSARRGVVEGNDQEVLRVDFCVSVKVELGVMMMVYASELKVHCFR